MPSAIASSEPDVPCSPVVGTQPFAVQLGGISAYFPEGRGPSKPVVLTMQEQMLHATLAEDASLTFTMSGGDCAFELDARLAGPDGGIVGRMIANVGNPASDIREDRTSSVRWCASPLGASTIHVASRVDITRVESLELSVSAPVLAPPTLKATLDGAPLDLAVESTRWDSLALKPAAGAFPRGHRLWVDLKGLLDPSGRPLVPEGVDAGASPLVDIALLDPSADVADLTFTTSPPPGSFLTGSGDRLRVAIGIGGVATSHAVRVRHRLVCDARPRSGTRAYVVSSEGKVAPLTIECASTGVESRAELPGAPPWSIVVVGTPNHSRPCNYPDMTTTPRYAIERVDYE